MGRSSLFINYIDVNEKRTNHTISSQMKINLRTAKARNPQLRQAYAPTMKKITVVLCALRMTQKESSHTTRMLTNRRAETIQRTVAS